MNPMPPPAVATNTAAPAAIAQPMEAATSARAAGHSAAAIVSRIAAAVLGGYAFTWGFTTLGIALGLAAGLPYPQAQTTMYLLAFLVYLAGFCWAFAARGAGRVWAVLAGGGTAMTGLAWLLLPAAAA